MKLYRSVIQRIGFQRSSISVLSILLLTVPIPVTASSRSGMPHSDSLSHTSQELTQVAQGWSGEWVGTEELSVEVLQGNPNLGTATLQQVFHNARWNFHSDGSFSFNPPPEAQVRRDFFPITGTYSKTGDTLQIQGKRQGNSGSQVSMDGSIQLTGTTAKIDLIYTAIAGTSQRTVRVSQTLTESNHSATPQTTTINGISVPAVFSISLQGTTEAQAFGPIPGVLKIVPSPYPSDPNPFFVSLQTDDQSQLGSLFWSSYAPPQAQAGQDELYSAITIVGNQVRLELHPSRSARPDISWFTAEPGTLGAIIENSPVGTATVQSGQITFSIQGSQVTGKIEASGTSWFGRSTTYQAQFTGSLNNPSASSTRKQLLSQKTEILKAQASALSNDSAATFNGVWESPSFEQIELQQQNQQVQGTYTGRGGGKITGTVQADRLDFTWQDATGEGWGFLRILPNDKLVGMWGTGTAGNGGVSLIATRQAQANPTADLSSANPDDLRYSGYELVQQGQCGQAVPRLEQSLALYRRYRNDPQVSSLLKDTYLINERGVGSYLSACYLALQDYDRLLTQLTDTLEVIRLLNQRDYLREVNQQQADQIQGGLAGFWENRRNQLKTDFERINALEQGKPLFDKLVEYLVETGATEEALLASESARARAFADLLTTRLSAETTRRASTTLPTLEQIKTIAQEHNVTLVEYFIARETAELFIWVVQPNGEIQFRRHPLLPGVALDALVDDTLASLGLTRKLVDVRPRPGAPQPDRQQEYLREFHQLLIEPIASLLPTDANAPVIFIPQGELFSMPFPALQDAAGNFLIDQHTILTAPSIQVLEKTRQQQVQVQQANLQSVLVVGNPTMPSVSLPSEFPQQLSPLPGSETEAEAIAPLFHTEALTRGGATKSIVVQRMSSAHIIHLATHGLLDDQQGLESAIALAPDDTGEINDGLLTAVEIAKMQLHAELVVLSACDTGQGRITGDGVIGLSRSLIAAGVPSVIVSLWAIPDAPTADLMEEFYRQYQQTRNKAQALRRAMQVTKAKHPNPRDWAAFTLIGEAE